MRVMDMRPDVDLSLRIVRGFLGDVEAAWEASNVERARGSLLSIEVECARLRAELGDVEAEREWSIGCGACEDEDGATVLSGGGG